MNTLIKGDIAEKKFELLCIEKNIGIFKPVNSGNVIDYDDPPNPSTFANYKYTMTIPNGVDLVMNASLTLPEGLID